MSFAMPPPPNNFDAVLSQSKWHEALAGWICAGICAVIALVLLIWVRPPSSCAVEPCVHVHALHNPMVAY